MRIITLLVFGALSFSSPSWAVLAPNYESVREYKALLDDAQLPELLGPYGAIQSIERTASGFIVKSQDKELIVDLVYDPVNMPGPVKFHLVFR